jgi:taurine dioxygenase
MALGGDRTMSFATRPLQPFGVEIEFDLRRPLSTVEQDELRRLLFEESLIVCRGQNLSIDEQARVLGYIGPVLHANGEYRTISSDGNLGAQKLGYHSDLSFTSNPFKVISLFAVHVVPDQTYTRFANGIRALQHLPKSVHSRLEGQTALAVISAIQTERKLPYAPSAILPQVERSAILPHPETGEPILYVSELQTARIGKLPEAESDALIAELFGYLYAEDNVYEHRWRNGDLVIWDNLALQHARPDLAGCVPRVLNRIVVADKTFFELCPQFDLKDPRIARWAAGEALEL